MSTVRLRPGVHYAPIDGGVYFSSARATFVMKGPAVLFRVVDTCVALLEDGTDIDHLVAAVGTPAAEPLVAHLVRTFDARGLLLAVDHLLGPEPSPQERRRFPESLAYLESYQDQPYVDFGRIRAAHVLVAGPAEALGPAVRGLLRAGAGQILVATPEPERLAALSTRHPEVRVERWRESEALPFMVDVAPQAAVIFSDDAFPAEAVRQLPAGCVVVAVRLAKDLAIVGPVLVAGRDGDGIEELWARAAEWCRRDGDELLVRPSGDLLAGALAGQAAFDALVGLNPGRVHLIHGPDLSADSITATLAAESSYEPATTLTSASATAPAAPALDWRDAVSAPWSGLFRLSVPGDVPQMPVAVTMAEGRTRWFDGRVLGIGPDQEASTTQAALEGLRRHCDGWARAHQGDAGWPAVAAAGLDETEWLLDGALRLLAQVPGREEPMDWMAVDDTEARRLWRALEDYELVPACLSAGSVGDFGWTVVSVRDRRTDALLARGWGPSQAGGAIAALSAALANQQVSGSAEAGSARAATAPGFVHHLHRSHAASLNASVESWLTTNGLHVHGRRLAGDRVAGPIGAWCGAVWFGA